MGTASYTSSSGSDTSSIIGTDSSPTDAVTVDESPAAGAVSLNDAGATSSAFEPSTSQPQTQVTAAAAQPNTPRIRPTVPTVVTPAGIRLVPKAFQHCEMPDIIALTTYMLDRILAYNDSLPNDRPLTRFHSKAAPAITPHAYLTRITTFTNVDPCIIIILLYYIDKLADYLTISSLTVHRFLISAICCGSKALSDSFATNSRYARVGGVELVEMNALEREFLLAINWRLATSGAMLEQYWITAVEAHPGYQIYVPPLPPPTSSSNPAIPHIAEALPSSKATGTINLTAGPPPPQAGSLENGRPHKRPKGEASPQ